ncbi:hypothetical protein A3H26_00270 [candidate division WWE3 bacterium RIFCSPLOWO2_12_FULL_36_10]|uniref:HTH arsR-type domain-containing protein n=1 Tax=candidate division WWE3 bacterium RIFCSPLOWO2_12_FULL_36_10 TaxID=1802630 RepID=A0A1F4VHX9_UNCKA|nr:MAG: hypothetical protein A3H26_00270 [candidate division WWE3 bacterium RIFCSPLOWO2_12_FULL_36_10]
MLKDLFVSAVRVKILKIFLFDKDKSYHVRSLVRAVGSEINAVRRELQKLTSIGFLRRRPSGNRVYYSLNSSSIYYPELLSLFVKEDGIGADIIKAEKELGNAKYAVLARSFVRGRASTVLDVDLFVVGGVNIEVLKNIVSNEEKKQNRELNYTVMGEDEFNFRKRRNDPFIVKILSQSRVMLIGDEEEFSSIS